LFVVIVEMLLRYISTITTNNPNEPSSQS